MAGKLIAFRRAEAAPQSSELSDEALLAACAIGDTSSLGVLYDRHHTSVRRFLGRVLGGQAAELDDLVQATFIEVWRSAAQFRGRSEVKSWMLGIANNVARHHVRSEKRRRSALDVLFGRPQPDVARPDEVSAHHEMIDRLKVALTGLPHDLRVAFVMCDLEEIPGVEAAAVLDVRPGTLWRRLHDARRRLRDALEGRTP